MLDSYAHLLELAHKCGGLLCVLLIEYIFVLSHAFGLDDTILFPFLIPAPLVDLRLRQTCLRRNVKQGFFGPVRVRVKGVRQLFQLERCLSLALADDPLQLAVHFVEDVSTTF